MSNLTVGELKKRIEHMGDDVRVMALRSKGRFDDANLEEIDIDLSDNDVNGHREADMFTLLSDREKVVVIL